jgi:hypothetical protein
VSGRSLRGTVPVLPRSNTQSPIKFGIILIGDFDPGTNQRLKCRAASFDTAVKCVPFKATM